MKRKRSSRSSINAGLYSPMLFYIIKKHSTPTEQIRLIRPRYAVGGPVLNTVDCICVVDLQGLLYSAQFPMASYHAQVGCPGGKASCTLSTPMRHSPPFLETLDSFFLS